MTPEISAIICTYNRKELLLDAVQSLVEQDLPKERYEILVVDNNSSDGTAEAVQERFGAVENLRYVFEPKQGVSRARNRGTEDAKSPIVAFTDDDALVPREWCRRFLEVFASLDPTAGCIGGEIEPVFEGERPSWLSDRLLRPLSVGLMWENGPRYTEEHEWLCEVNMALRRAPVLEHGGFPEELGRVGYNLLSGEQIVTDIMRSSGWGLYYEPSIVVQHRVPQSRLTRTWFRRRMFWQGVSQYVAGAYLRERGYDEVHLARRRAYIGVPRSASDWVHAFDDDGDEAEFERTLEMVEAVGYLLASQNVIGGR